jgi:hypothetical protein
MALSRSVLQVLAAGAVWRAVRARMAGRFLVRSLDAHNEDARTLAGMLLTRDGSKALPLLREAMAQHKNLPTVLTIIGSIGDRSMEPELRRFVFDNDPQVARAAKDSLRILVAD